MDYSELKRKAEVLRDTQNTKAKENYHYARSLGFSSREAVLLSVKSKEEIDRIAKDRDDGNGA